MNIVLAVTGATGAILPVRFVQKLKEVAPDTKIHLVVSEWGAKTLALETDYTLKDLQDMCDFAHDNRDLAAAISSGSFQIDAMLVLPCSMKTVSAISTGYTDSLIVRAADVCLKEKRRIIICPRETPFNAIHLENLLKLANVGCSIVPFMPAFYQKPESLDDIIEHFIVRLIDQLNISINYNNRWKGI